MTGLCDQIRLLVGPFDDGELEPHEMEDIALHIVSCTECKAILDDYRELGVALRDAVVAPSLDGFAQAVEARIASLSAPLRVRVRRYLERLSDGFGAALALGAAAAAAAILTFIVVSPGVSRMVNRAPALASVPTIAPPAETLAQASISPDYGPLLSQAERNAADDSRELVEEIEADGPSVALWNEPQTDTTVIWVPGQQP